MWLNIIAVGASVAGMDETESRGGGDPSRKALNSSPGWSAWPVLRKTGVFGSSLQVDISGPTKCPPLADLGPCADISNHFVISCL